MTTESDPTVVATALHSAAIQLLRRLRKQDELSGLSAARMSALSVLVFGGARTIGQLAEAEQVSAPTMTRLVAGMQAEKLVTRQADKEDRRVVWVKATRRGERILHEGRRRRVEALASALRSMTPEQVSAIAYAIPSILTSVARISIEDSAR